MDYARKYIAEFLGTMLLVVFGCGSAVAANALIGKMGLMVPFGFTTLTIALAFGLIMAAMIYAFGTVSGAHINPAVSLGMFIAGRIAIKDFAGYVAAQFIGGIAGAEILVILFRSRTSLGANGYGNASALGAGMIVAFVIEVILTFVFVLVFINVTSKVENGAVSGIVIGLTLTLVHLLGTPFTGTSVNPARSLGPAVFSGGEALHQVWVFILAPLVGAAIAALVYRFVVNRPETTAKEETINIEEILFDQTAE